MLNITNNIFGDIMKKRILQILLTIMYLIILPCCTNNSDELRLRIVANSNSIEDQEFKIEVKNFIANYLENKNVLDIDILALEEVLKKEFEDLIIVEKRFVSYEAKAYQGKFIKSGMYETILITIGSGKGKNFWTLLYPEFFSISFEEDHEIEYRSFIYDKLFT